MFKISVLLKCDLEFSQCPEMCHASALLELGVWEGELGYLFHC